MSRAFLVLGADFMIDKLEAIEQKFISLEQTLMEPGLDGRKFASLTKERSSLEDIVHEYRSYKKLLEDKEQAVQMADSEDQEERAFAKEELEHLQNAIEEIKKRLTLLMLPTDPNDSKNIILEVRAGTGGEEAGIFCGDLLRMYTRFAEKQGWRVEMMSSTESAKGGFKEVVCLIEGKKVYSRLKFEMGVHRVQRVPETESQGRIHTSACTVAVLPEAEEIEVEINPADLRIDTYRSSGAGGQHVNTTDSAVRITHLPTGTVAECQDERSQHKNRDKAMKMLRTRIYEKLEKSKDAEISADRKNQVGSGDRSERIRTYNFPQGRITDHRINLTLYKLDEVMGGNIEEILNALGAHHTANLLKGQGGV